MCMVEFRKVLQINFSAEVLHRYEAYNPSPRIDEIFPGSTMYVPITMKLPRGSEIGLLILDVATEIDSLEWFNFHLL